MKEDVISLRSEAMARRAGLGQGGKRLGEGERLFHIVRANRWRQLGVWGLGSGVWGTVSERGVFVAVMAGFVSGTGVIVAGTGASIRPPSPRPSPPGEGETAARNCSALGFSLKMKPGMAPSRR